MTVFNRRRFLSITAAMMAAGTTMRAGTVSGLTVWRGVALGSGAQIALAHPEADAIIGRARAEIARLEGIFSLYSSGSTLSSLNREGTLTAPPFELLECLSIANAVHGATGGRFDPTIQPLWAAYAEAAVQGVAPQGIEALPVGWEQVRFSEAAITLAPGMAITLNGIAQGYIADRVAAMLRAEGLENVLIDTGEIHAMGDAPARSGWPVQTPDGEVVLRNRAVATSSPRGTVLDAKGVIGHILDPRSRQPAAPIWQSVTISAPSAALADALSTAACLAGTKNEILADLSQFAQARLDSAVLA